MAVITPNASTLDILTVDEVTARTSSAVVRIETNLGTGSGFIIDPDGFVLTNNDVISDAKEVTVILEGGISYTGKVHAKDLVRDAAVIKIGANDFPWIELGYLSQVPLASDVLVLGFPNGVTDLVVTRGLNITWVQTDAPINPGNSGGPLLNLQGQAIGVVTSKLIDSGLQNIGFAVSSNTVELNLERLTWN